MKLLSIGKNWWVIFLSLIFEIIFAELKVLEVINIWSIFFDLSYFSNRGIMLWISPTLAPWNHTNFPLDLFFVKKLNFSLNLIKSSETYKNFYDKQLRKSEWFLFTEF